MAMQRKPWWGRLGMSGLILLALGYLGIVVFLAVFQRHLVFVPTRLTVEQAQGMAKERDLQPWLNPAGELIGWQVPAGTNATGQVMIVHGNGGTALYLSRLAHAIHDALAVNAFILEYPGYGQRGGEPTMASLLEAAEEGFAMLPTNGPAYVVSESLGTGVAAHLARKYPARVAGLLMFVPYDQLASVAQSHYPWLPAYWLLRDRFAPADWLADYHGPVKIVLAGRDEIIPIARGQVLYDGYAGPKTVETVAGARHGETLHHPPEWWRAVRAFWEAHR